MPSAPLPGVDLPWLDGGGATAELVRRFDWSLTPLGPIESWPSSLRTIVGVLLHSRHPMFLWWGDELIQIYNDAYVPSFGVGKHPAALGQRGPECWQEIWPIIGPQIDDVLRHGKACWFEDALVPIFRNGQLEDVYWTYGYSPVFLETGAIGGVLVVCTETTARVQATVAKEAARALVEQERARLFRFFAQAPAGICLLRGPDFVFEFANEQYERLVGRSQLVGKPLLEALPELEGQHFDELLRAVVRKDEVFVGREVRVSLTRAESDTDSLADVYCTFIYSPIRDVAGVVEGVSVFAIDVTAQVTARQKAEALAAQLQKSEGELGRLLATAQRERENAEGANRAKDEFLTTASHELRTPLSAILGWARLLRAGQLDPSAYLRGLETIERNAQAQVRLIEDILDGSRIITGKLRLEIRRLDLTQLVTAAVDGVRPAAEAKGISLTLELDPSAARVVGDPERLQQVVWNLCNNAIKFTPKGGAVSVRLRRVDTDIELEVSDDGVGIGPDFLPHVFERFRQGEGSTTRRYGGLGLGLALVRHLVEAHGGSVRAASAGVGLGATFSVRLPVQAVFAQEPDSGRVSPVPRAEPLPAAVDLTGVSVLVVDDETDARELVSTVLRGSGASVSTATSAGEALGLLATALPLVLLSDIGMPETDGYELIRRVRTELGAEGALLPAIALTAYAREEDRRLALEAGFNHHVSKPVEPAELARIVASAAAGSARRHAQAPPEVAGRRANALVKLERWLQTAGVHETLRFLNSRTSHRFTGIYRFDGDIRRGVHLFDAELPDVRQGDDTPLAETYCAIVRQTESAFTTSDGRRDDRLRAHPARAHVVSYCGLLLRAAGGNAFGTLCHFDFVPCDIPTSEMPLLEAAGRLLMGKLTIPASAAP